MYEPYSKNKTYLISISKITNIIVVILFSAMNNTIVLVRKLGIKP
jgi:hypothetical protein